MRPPPHFGKRGLVGAPLTRAPTGLAGLAEGVRRRLRSRMVVVGCAGAIALTVAAAAEYRREQCQPTDPANPNSVPAGCRSSGHGSGGHGFSGAGTAHASFGGFGGHGAGHGGGS